MSVTHLFPQLPGAPRAATVDDLQFHWPTMRKALRDIRKQQGLRATWQPEHVLSAIRSGQAELWIVTACETVLDAFVVTQTIIDSCLHVPHGLFVWQIWRASHTPKHLLTELLDGFLTQLARDRGLLYLEGLTCWRGLADTMAQRGWETVGYVTRKQLEEP